MPPRPHGRLLPQDAEGYLLNPCDPAHLTPRWRPAIDAAVGVYRAELGEALRSVWLRGSVPRGLATPGVSDLDTLALVAPGAPLSPPWLRPQSVRLSQAHPEVEGVELWLLDEAALLQDPDQRRRLGMLATQALCVWGDDLRGRLPRIRPGLDTVYACRALGPHLQDAFADLQAPEDEADRLDCIRWIAKCLVRAGLEICLPVEPVFTRDLWPCWEVFTRHHPARSAAMFEVMAWAIAPAEAPPDVEQRLRVLGAWLTEQAAAVWGEELVGLSP